MKIHDFLPRCTNSNDCKVNGVVDETTRLLQPIVDLSTWA